MSVSDVKQLFLFQSRRRHTRSLCDWSSDVCSSDLEGRRGAGFVIVIEDTSDLLRAQKITAWSEVARRVAHEIRNPLTPITLSAERIVRQLNRQQFDAPGVALPPAIEKVVRECAATILDETASVK